jgi:hypothetical protein
LRKSRDTRGGNALADAFAYPPEEISMNPLFGVGFELLSPFHLLILLVLGLLVIGIPIIAIVLVVRLVGSSQNRGSAADLQAEVQRLREEVERLKKGSA